MNINPTVHASDKYYSKEEKDLITIFPKSSKEGTPSLFESISFKEDK